MRAAWRGAIATITPFGCSVTPFGRSMPGETAGSSRQRARATMNEQRNAGSSMERRGSERVPVEMWVEESNERELYFQRGANISAGGIFLRRTIPHPKGTRVRLRFTLPGDTVPVEVRGEIVNVGDDEADLGMGVRFVDLAPRDAGRIADFIRRAGSKSVSGG